MPERTLTRLMGVVVLVAMIVALPGILAATLPPAARLQAVGGPEVVVTPV